MEITIKNYRCFPDSRPVQLNLRPGFSAFLGVNNAGKSSLLKMFHECRNLFSLLASPAQWLSMMREGQPDFGFLSTLDPAEVFCNQNDRGISLSVTVRSEGTEISEGYDARLFPSRVTLEIPRGTARCRIVVDMDGGRIDPTNTQLGGPILRDTSGRVKADLRPYLDAFRDLSRTMYIGPFRNLINVGTNDEYFDIETGQSCINRWQNLKTGNIKERSESIYRVTEVIERVFGFQKLDISGATDGKTLQVFADGKVYKLQELGAGLSQFVIVLMNAAIKRPSFILIDEPEAGLHASLQMVFLNTLASFADRGVLFATHSLGLSRSAADWVYSVRKEADSLSSVRPLEATTRLSEIAGELSFSGYKELGFSKIVLVEGPKDVKTIQLFLRQLRKDHTAVLIPLGGSGGINAAADGQLEEIKRLSTDVLALIDSERKSEGEELAQDRKGFVAACGRAGVNCHVLERRAIENYLTDNAVKKIKGEKYRALTPYERLADMSPAWAKEENWRIAQEMKLEDLDHTDLRDFLNLI